MAVGTPIVSYAAGTASSTIPITLSETAQIGSLLVVCFSYQHTSRTFSNITDSNAETDYTEAVSHYTDAFRGGIYYKTLTSTVTSLTVNLSGATFGADSVCVYEIRTGVTGAVTGTPAEQYEAATSAPTSGDTTPATANNILIGLLNGSQNRLSSVPNAYNWNGSYTVQEGNTSAESGYGYLIQTSATAGAFSATTDDADESVTTMTAAFAGSAGGLSIPIVRHNQNRRRR